MTGYATSLNYRPLSMLLVSRTFSIVLNGVLKDEDFLRIICWG